ncbi:hypothetical protein Tco_0037681 [Tanacetum coccineum]
MSSDNTSFAVTYTSISSDSNGPSWGIPLVNVDELLKMDPYEEVAQQWQAPPLLPAYVPDPMELDEYVLVYVSEPEHPEYHVPSDDDIQVEDQPYVDDASPTVESPGYIVDSDSMEEDSIDYPDEPEDDDEDPEEDDNEDPEEDPSEEHEPEDDDEDPDEDLSEEHEPEDDDEDPEEDPSEEQEPEDEDTKEEDPSEGSDETGPFEEDETAVTPPPRHRRARISVRLSVGHGRLSDLSHLCHRATMIRIRDDILKEDMPPRRRFVLTAPLPGCDVVESSVVAAARAPRGQYDFVDTIEAGQGLIRSPGHDARTIARAVDRVEDVGYVRALQASEHRMMTSIEEVNLRVSYQAQVRRQESGDFYTQLLDAQTDRRDIRLEIDVVRGQRTAYETELHEVRQAYLSFEAQNRALLARLKTLETYMSRMEWQRQRAEDDAVRQMMRTHVLEARAQIDTVEDTGSSC